MSLITYIYNIYIYIIYCRLVQIPFGITLYTQKNETEIQQRYTRVGRWIGCHLT